MAKKKVADETVNVWSMIRDVLIRSIDRGQFPLALLWSFGIIILIRAPKEILSDLFKACLERIHELSYISYLANFLFVAGWIIHVRILRNMHKKEIDRCAQIKSKLQKDLNPAVESSE